MQYRALALMLVLGLSGCGVTDYITRTKTMHRTTTTAQVIKEPIKEYVALPPELLLIFPVAKADNRSVKEYVRVANTNTPLLQQCYRQIEEIRKLQPEPEEK